MVESQHQKRRTKPSQEQHYLNQFRSDSDERAAVRTAWINGTKPNYQRLLQQYYADIFHFFWHDQMAVTMHYGERDAILDLANGFIEFLLSGEIENYRPADANFSTFLSVYCRKYLNSLIANGIHPDQPIAIPQTTRVSRLLINEERRDIFEAALAQINLGPRQRLNVPLKIRLYPKGPYVTVVYDFSRRQIERALVEFASRSQISLFAEVDPDGSGSKKQLKDFLPVEQSSGMSISASDLEDLLKQVVRQFVCDVAGSGKLTDTQTAVLWGCLMPRKIDGEVSTQRAFAVHTGSKKSNVGQLYAKVRKKIAVAFHEYFSPSEKALLETWQTNGIEDLDPRDVIAMYQRRVGDVMAFLDASTPVAQAD